MKKKTWPGHINDFLGGYVLDTCQNFKIPYFSVWQITNNIVRVDPGSCVGGMGVIKSYNGYAKKIAMLKIVLSNTKHLASKVTALKG